MEGPPPGIYPNVPFAEYCRWSSINHSILKNLDTTPAHAHWRMTHQDESTKFQDLGHMLHQALLEPKLFAESHLVAPDVDRRTKIGKAEWAAFEERAAGRTIVSESEMACLHGIQANAAVHATVREALYGVGVSELSMVWEDPETGLLCKGRIDRLCEIGGWPFVVDLKTTHKPATTFSWQMSVERYKLHEQAAHYLRGLAVLRPLHGESQRKFAWLVAETEPPYAVRIFEAEDAALSIGNDVVSKHLQQFKECKEAGVWPSWPEGMDLAGLPAWAYRRFDGD